MEFSSLLQMMIDRNATDMHLAARIPPVLRIDGAILPSSTEPHVSPLIDKTNAAERHRSNLRDSQFDQDQIIAILEPLLSPQQHETLARRGVARLLIPYDKYEFLVTVFGGPRRWTAAVRKLIPRAPNLMDLSAPVSLSKVGNQTQGLILITGPAGSGKDSTAAAILNHINMSRSTRVLTIEANPSYVASSKMSLVTQLLVGLDLETTGDGLRLAKNEDVELVYVDDLTDIGDVRRALDLAEMGRLVIATLSVKDASAAINRLIDQSADGAADIRRRLAKNLVAVIAQQRMPGANEDSRQTAYEILLGTSAVKKLIAGGEHNLRPAMRAGRDEMMITMEDAVRQHFNRGFITEETMRERTAPYLDEED